MRLRVCTLDEITLRTRDGFGRCLGRGAVVDLDAVLGSDGDGRDVTVEVALGDRVDAFIALEVEAPVLPSPALDDPEDGADEEH